MEVCSALIHKFEANVCSTYKSSETDSLSHGHIADNEKVKNEDEEERKEEKDESITSSDISTSSNQQLQTTMGNEISKNKPKKSKFTELTDRQIELLVSSTNFTAQQVREWHQSSFFFFFSFLFPTFSVVPGFLNDCPSGLFD